LFEQIQPAFHFQLMISRPTGTFLIHFRDHAFDKLMRQNWQGGQSSARQTRGLATGGAHGVARPAQFVCHLDDPNLLRKILPNIPP
jgi:hypothetical protein